MANKWTNEQSMAINKRNCDILVAAAAGSGKTAVLVERIIQIVCSKETPVDIDRLLVLTFTNAAASQMRERIDKAINKKLEEDPENIHLQRQLTLLNKAYITTIDSFCLRVVKENYMKVGLDPAFRTADERECDLIRSQVLEDLFEEKYSDEENEGFISLVESFGEDTGDKNLKALILELYDFVQTNPFPNQWLEMSCENFNPQNNHIFEATKWGKEIAEKTIKRLGHLIEKTNSAIEIAKSPNGPMGYIDSLLKDLDWLEELKNLASKDIKKVGEELSGFKFPVLGRKKKDDDEVLVERVKTLRDLVKKGITDLFEDYYFYSSEDFMELHKKIYPVAKVLTETVAEFSQRFGQAKREKLLVDFNDMEHYALEILLEEGSTIDKPILSQVAINMRNRFFEVMTDEYQDSNLVQEMLLCAVAGKSRFMVGDVKQSIYRFRQAEPSIFLKKYEEYTNEGNQIRIDLSKNFRSRKNILDSINLVFSQIMTLDVGEIEYNEKSALYSGAAFPSFTEEEKQAPVELAFINRADMEEDFEDNEEEEMDTASLEMTYVAKRITEMIDEGFQVYDENKGYRNITFGDIVILLRSTPNWVSAAGEALTAAGIPSLSPTQSSYFDNSEVMFIVNVLSLVDNFRQDIPIMAVLKSPVYKVDDDELLDIRLINKEEGFYQCIIKYMEEGENLKTKEKLKSFYSHIQRWKEISLYTPVNELLWIIYWETGYFDYIGVKRLGKRRQANLRLLAQRAEMLEKTNFKGLFNFLRYVEKLKTLNSDLTEASVLEETSDMVKIMTIHKSKGLEFPVVFVCGLGRNFNLMDISKKVLMHQQDGIGMEYIDYENRVRHNTISKSLLKERIKNETLSEEMRILYVALTRAKEKLILTSSLRDLEKSCLKWSNFIINSEDFLSPYDMGKVTNFIDWLAPALVRHKSGEAILNYSGISQMPKNSKIYNHTSLWDIRLIQKSEIKSWLRESDFMFIESEEEETQQETIDAKELLGYSYKYALASSLPANVSVSEIKNNHRALEEEFTELYPALFEFKKPIFLSEVKDEEVLTNAQKGTLIHQVMEKLDFKENYNEEQLKSFVLNLYKNGFISRQEYKAVNIKPINKFFESFVGENLKKADRIYKEESFAMEISPFEVYGKEDYKEIKEEILIHGIIDCFYILGNEVVLIDYKNDYVSDKTGEELKNKYKIQLEIYEKAIERIIGKKVTSKYIYSFYLNKAVRV